MQEVEVEKIPVEPEPDEVSQEPVSTVMEELSREPWWSTGEGEPPSVREAVDVFARLMDTVPRDTFQQICDYIIRIHKWVCECNSVLIAYALFTPSESGSDSQKIKQQATKIKE